MILEHFKLYFKKQYILMKIKRHFNINKLILLLEKLIIFFSKELNNLNI